jgi:hypothetical protein
MKRGKVIGAVVLVGAIALVIAQRLNGPADDMAAGNSGAGAGTASSVLGQADRPAGGPSAGANPALAAAGLSDGQNRTYTIDNAESEVYWRIYRSGLFAAAAHSHVISIGELAGGVTLGSDLAAAQWNLSFPVESLIIDDPALRARYGEEFESVPSEDDKAGTKRNMMTDRVLNGEVFTEISLSGTGLNGNLENASLPVSIQMLGRTIEQSFPASITIGADAVTVTGEYRLTHEDLGMEPFSAFGGAIAVGDEIDFTYRIHAVAGGQ